MTNEAGTVKITAAELTRWARTLAAKVRDGDTESDGRRLVESEMVGYPQEAIDAVVDAIDASTYGKPETAIVTVDVVAF